MEDRTYKLNAKNIDLLTLLEQVFSEGDDLARSKELELSIEMNGCPRKEGDRFELVCDELLFYSMMSNLVKNAMEASPRGGPVKVTVHENNDLRIGIENKGVVNPSIRSCFFEKFVTADKPKGTGIGTYSARLTAEMHGADIRLFTSDEEKETRVEIKWDRTPRVHA